MPQGDEQGGAGAGRGGSDRPEYKVYRARPGLLSRFRAPDVASLRERLKGGERPPRKPKDRPPERAKPRRKRRWLRWALIVAGVWILISLLAFGVSAQIQKSKLADGAADQLGGNPALLAFPQTILVIGTDAREASAQDQVASEKCLEQQARGQSPHAGCPGFRADTLMLVRAGRGAFRKLSIPRDSYAEIPGHDPQKINSAYAFGGAALQIETVEGFLGIDVDHAVIVDFDGFKDFIDAIGGVEVDLPDSLCSEISGGEANGGFSLAIGPGKATLNGQDALSFARTRTNTCAAEGGSDEYDNYDDLDRAAAQQEILSGIKGRLTSPLRLPYNFIKGPIIGWTAPKAMVSDMGVLTMPQLVLASAIGGDSEAEVLEPSGPGPAPGSLEIPAEERQRAVDKLVDE